MSHPGGDVAVQVVAVVALLVAGLSCMAWAQRVEPLLQHGADFVVQLVGASMLLTQPTYPHGQSCW